MNKSRGTVVFDVDGTLCDVRTIRYHVDPTVVGYSGHKDFNRFHAASEWMPANRWVSRLLFDLAAQNYWIAIVTGREERWADLTERWLNVHEIHFDVIHYRPNKDDRTDADVKADYLTSLQRSGTVLLAVDDSPSVIEVWRANSVPVVGVDEGSAPIKLSAKASGLDPNLSRVLRKHQLLS